MEPTVNVCTLSWIKAHTFGPLFISLCAHAGEECTQVATYTKLGSGNWRVQIRRKGRYVSETFRHKKDAEEWALDIERRIDKGEEPTALKKSQIKFLSDLVDIHNEYMREVGRPARRSKGAVLEALKAQLGSVRICDLSRERLIDYGRRRAKEGAGPATRAIDFSFLRTILTHAAAVHGIEVSAENVRLARIALTRLGLIGRSTERHRQPLESELEMLIEYFEGKQRQIIPLGQIIRFAVATAMRHAEICSLHWDDVDLRRKIATI